MADSSWFMAEHLGVHHGDRPVAILAATGENEQSLRDARAPATPRTCRSCAVSPVLRQSSLRIRLTHCATAAGGVVLFRPCAFSFHIAGKRRSRSAKRD